MGHVLLFGGPNGAGKDTLERRFDESSPFSDRIVRHYTRAPHENEQDGVDYHFVSEQVFEGMIEEDDFLEHASYVGCRSGTSRSEINSCLERSPVSTLTANYEDALTIKGKLDDESVPNTCLFVSPCSEEKLIDEPKLYLDALRARMKSRGRTSDSIEGRLIKASEYRETYISNPSNSVYIDNSTGEIESALRNISQYVISLGLERP